MKKIDLFHPSGVLLSKQHVLESEDWLQKNFGFRHADKPKSWDLANMLRFIQENVPKNGKVLDLGAMGSPVTVLLRKKGFSRLVACDLNHSIIQPGKKWWRGAKSAMIQKARFWWHGIQFDQADLHHTHYDSNQFDAITCVSVLEHGCNVEQFMKESSRLLKKGGYLLVSVDYWPTPIDTRGATEFGLPWNIFSKQKIQEAIRFAKKNRMELVGKPSWEAKEKTVRWMGKGYTFASMAFQKN